MDSVSLSELSYALGAIVGGYVAQVEDQMREDVDAAAEAAREAIAAGSPSRTGAYRGGWQVGDDSGAYSYGKRVHNAAKPGLPHLLDKGHAKRGGGFVSGDGHVRAGAEVGIAELNRRLHG